MIFKKDEIEDSMEDYVSRKEFNKLKRRINSHQSYLNFINTFYELEPKPFLEQLTGLSYEFIRFFDNVCLKHGIEYWIDLETLRSAVLHGEMVPWNDEMNVAMAENDYLKLIEFFNYGTDFENVSFDDDGERLKVKFNPSSFEWDLISINVFMYDLDSFKENIVFPLERIPFGKCDVFAPNDSYNYLKEIYDETMAIPPKVHDHGRFNEYLNRPDIVEVLKKANSVLAGINEEF